MQSLTSFSWSEVKCVHLTYVRAGFGAARFHAHQSPTYGTVKVIQAMIVLATIPHGLSTGTSFSHWLCMQVCTCTSRCQTHIGDEGVIIIRTNHACGGLLCCAAIKCASKVVSALPCSPSLESLQSHYQVSQPSVCTSVWRPSVHILPIGNHHHCAVGDSSVIVSFVSRRLAVWVALPQYWR